MQAQRRELQTGEAEGAWPDQAAHTLLIEQLEGARKEIACLQGSLREQAALAEQVKVMQTCRQKYYVGHAGYNCVIRSRDAHV